VNLNSFRLKLALFSGLITGLLLVGSAAVLWRVTYRFNLDRLDHEIRNLGQANLDRVVGGDHWQRLDDALKFVSGNAHGASFALWIRNYDRVVYQSPVWPADISAESFPELSTYEDPDIARPGYPLPPPPRRGEAISPSNPALPRKTARFYTQSGNGRHWRIGVMGNSYVTLIIAADIDGFNRNMAQLRNTLLLLLPIALILAAGGAWLVARRALRPVSILTQTAEQVTARGLNQRIPEMPSDQEFNRLITVFNEMLNRLEKSFQQATRFSADASHELKTPLARLQAELEQALESAPPSSAEQQTYGSLLEEISRLKAIVQRLLLLAQADAGRLELKLQATNLTSLLAGIIEDSQAMAPDLAIESELSPQIAVQADPVLLEQALQNLAANAIKYNRASGRIRFELVTENRRVRLRIANTGAPIPLGDQPRLFERFYRADLSRSNTIGGAGLGLSLARELVRAHGGELVLESSDANWTCFAITLPQVELPSTAPTA
jgi:heavy metal sensor kinase